MTRRVPLVSARTWQHRQYLYGLDRFAFNALLDAQDGRCPVCSKLLDTERSHGIHVDHCHSTLMVRGLLCSSCNTNLGALESVQGWLSRNADAALRYLKHNASIPIVTNRQPPSREALQEKAEQRRITKNARRREERAKLALKRNLTDLED